MSYYGSGDEDTIITHYVNSNLENGIKQKNLDLIDEYIELKESII